MADIEIPSEMPMMTLSGVSLFPRAMLPLHIFEPRYRQMLDDVLSSNRLFCVAGQNDDLAEEAGLFEPPFPVASVGIVRASQKNADDTSNLVLQGLIRVKVKKIVQEEPYRVAEIVPLATFPGADDFELTSLQETMMEDLRRLQRLSDKIPEDLIKYFERIGDPDGVADLSIYTFCGDAAEKQALLETLDTAARMRRFTEFVRRENRRLELDDLLRGGLGEDEIERN